MPDQCDTLLQLLKDINSAEIQLQLEEHIVQSYKVLFSQVRIYSHQL